MRTLRYCQSQGAAPIDWYASIKEADALSDWYDRSRAFERLSEKSRSWVTCAVGNQCSILERSADGVPLDDELMQLGWDFNVAIEERNADRALQLLTKIERRSAKLIKQILNARVDKVIDSMLTR